VTEIRDQLCIALDVDDLVAAQRLARAVRPYFGVAKVGLELYSAAGPDAFAAMRELGYEVFADLKLHDIPNTVGRAARVIGSLGVRYLTLHAHGGVPMLQAGVDGFRSGALAAGLDDPIPLAVTVLTSDDTAPPHIVPNRIAAAIEAGCGGIVCAVADVADARSMAPRFAIVTPGIRPAGAEVGDQRRTATPAEALAAGSDLLVIGRPVSGAPDPVVAAEAIVASIPDQPIPT
jgi:orotidine-5'-phosphate decarboxylase